MTLHSKVQLLHVCICPLITFDYDFWCSWVLRDYQAGNEDSKVLHDSSIATCVKVVYVHHPHVLMRRFCELLCFKMWLFSFLLKQVRLKTIFIFELRSLRVSQTLPQITASNVWDLGWPGLCLKCWLVTKCHVKLFCIISHSWPPTVSARVSPASSQITASQTVIDPLELAAMARVTEISWFSPHSLDTDVARLKNGRVFLGTYFCHAFISMLYEVDVCHPCTNFHSK